MNIVQMLKDHKSTLAGVTASLLIWWHFSGSKKYTAQKGARKYV